MLVRWERLLEQIRLHDPKSGKGRAPYELESMLCVHCVQLFYNLNDPAMEDMLYESQFWIRSRGACGAGHGVGDADVANVDLGLCQGVSRQA